MTTVEFVERVRGMGIPGYGDDEVAFIFDAVRQLEPDLILDWGTNRGSSARILHEAADGSAFVWTIDLPKTLAAIDRDHSGDDTGHFLKGTSVRRLHGDGVTVALDIVVSTGAERPLFFVDGDHSYENVVRELRWIRRVAPAQSAILLHDTQSWPGEAARKVYGESHQIEELESQAGMMLVTKP